MESNEFDNCNIIEWNLTDSNNQIIVDASNTVVLNWDSNEIEITSVNYFHTKLYLRAITDAGRYDTVIMYIDVCGDETISSTDDVFETILYKDPSNFILYPSVSVPLFT